MKFQFDYLVLETFQRLSGIKAFLEVLDKVVPEIEWLEREELRRLAEEQGWDVGDYQAKGQVLDEKFRHWVQRFGPFSIIVLLCSAVETQLLACADRLGRDRNSTFRVKDIRAGVAWSRQRYTWTAWPRCMSAKIPYGSASGNSENCGT